VRLSLPYVLCLIGLILTGSPAISAQPAPATRTAEPGATSLLAPISLPRPAPEPAELYYTVAGQTTLYLPEDTSRAYLNLARREPVEFLPSADPGWPGWKRVRTLDGANGMVRDDALTNVWLRISKSTQTLFVYRGQHLIDRIPTDLGYNFFSDKEQRGSLGNPDHWRTPEGEFYVAAKNGQSKYHKAFVLNYPNAEDAERGLEDGLITQDQYEAILSAERRFAMPPMNTLLGGWIEIHGDGTGNRTNWTQGCIAIQNVQIDRLWDIIEVGTPVLITP